MLFRAIFIFVSFVPLFRTHANLIGIDIGTDFMKVALVAPRRPLEIVTNIASKRKTAMCIHFDRNERSLGGDALVMLTRKPSQTFTKITSLLGRNADHPDILAYNTTELPKIMFNETRKGIFTSIMDRGKESVFLPEELMAMMLDHAYDMTHLFGYTVQDAVITVPQFWTAHERMAMNDAVELSALSSLLFVDENTAAALQYSIDRPYNESFTVLFFNMGSASTQASIVTYGPKIVKERNVGQFEVKSKAWDTSLGGHWFDLMLADMMADKFNEKWKKGDVRQSPKAMAKLRTQANKVKHVLSGNAEIPVTIESLHDNIDFNTVVTRAEFEKKSSVLLSKVPKLIDEVLDRAGLDLSSINEVEIVGGGVRIPKIKEIISNHVKPINMGIHLNGDETFALGAAFAGANASRAFQVRQVGMTDITPFAVDLSLADAFKDEKDAPGEGGVFASIRQKLDGTEKDRENAEKLIRQAETSENDEKKDFHRNVQLYSVNSMANSKKAITIKHARDLRANITYSEENPFLPGNTQKMICSYNVTGIEDFAAETLKDNLGMPKVTLRFAMDGSGIPSLIEAFAEVQYEVEVSYEEEVEIEPEIEEKSERNETASENEGKGEGESGDDAGEGGADGKIQSKDDEGKEKAKKSKVKKEKVVKKKMVTNTKKRSLSVSRHFDYNALRPLNEEEKKESKRKLVQILGEEKARLEKAAAKNDLETYILMVRSAAGYDAKDELLNVTTEMQRKELVDLANELEEWLYDDGWDEEAAVYRSKKIQLSKPAEEVFYRVSEAKARPAEVKKAQLYLRKVRETAEKWKTSKPQITDDEIKDLLEKLEKVEKWLAEKMEKQEQLEPYEPPAFSSADVEPQLKTVNTLVSRLSKKPTPKVEKPLATEQKKNGTETAEERSSSEDLKEGENVEGEEGGDDLSSREEEGDEEESKDEL
mmetsp:Transcript_582/g.813  ORF Transcript_582/g.813 Transcript_582/m.813 type:complete len:936 (+) Transcript_582:121-2928(+)